MYSVFYFFYKSKGDPSIFLLFWFTLKWNGYFRTSLHWSETDAQNNRWPYFIYYVELQVHVDFFQLASFRPRDAVVNGLDCHSDGHQASISHWGGIFMSSNRHQDQPRPQEESTCGGFLGSLSQVRHLLTRLKGPNSYSTTIMRPWRHNASRRVINVCCDVCVYIFK